MCNNAYSQLTHNVSRCKCAELIDEAVDTIRREIEPGDCPQRIQLTQSIEGGTG